jgi:glyoxylase-like metal-dependent hydrolase (beta-lactamase superfamily II)
MIRTLSLAALALAISPITLAHGAGHFAQSAEQEVVIESTDLGDGIHMLVGQGGNIGVLAGEDGVFVIDSQFARIAPQNLAKINEIAGGTPTFLVNTHWHGDHTGGNANFGATIIAHDNVRARVSEDQNTTLLGNERNTPASVPAAWPAITFDDDITLHLNGQTIKVFHTPDAHTDGDAMVMFEDANILHMGDVFFVGNFPFIDVSSGGTVEGFINAMRTAHAVANDDTKIIPGHGPLATREDIAASIEMLEGVNAAASAAFADGLSVEDAVANELLGPWAEQWGNGFINIEVFTRLVFADYERIAAEKTAAAADAALQHEGKGS